MGLKIYNESLTNTECENGTYGYDCVNNCSGHCLNNSPCNKQTGHCDGGCNPGYTYKDCNKSKITDRSININDMNKFIFLSLMIYMHN